MAPVKVVEHCPTCGRALRGDSRVCPQCMRKRETFWRLAHYIRPYWGVALTGFLLTIVVTVINLLPPWLNKHLIDGVILPVSSKYVQTQDGVSRQVLSVIPQPIPATALHGLLVIVVALIVALTLAIRAAPEASVNVYF